ncbi:D-3-phosphoglycerate dehydrogenase-like protein [Thermochaetoides thermophila DSM 1495]|uniref:D-3-phosphoglycerate dehydrogenase n=1 Tax=Chaetomium thermophilum (strain DSM 1495 / CBS 144.50 / IMI 039719) TaxID=759272 RepID=G0SAR4_CHATD|nr:D-3-phosphoglycerate dehydrogenase-like protein [Thermochaetoides thermophila DSM 1495]EGS19836.1 D-3-phosphoglycerate dehydrogenase-like protein [Thermochaetoides thermophila DSM 1495]
MAPIALDPPSSSKTSTPFKILIPERLSPEGLSILRSSPLPIQIDTPSPLSPANLLKLIPSYDALIVRSETKVTSAVLEAGTKLRVVARAGVGVDNIDVDAATKAGVVVVNSPSGNILAAAEHTIALLMAVARNVGAADRGVKEGRWERGKLIGVEVGRKTLGIIGFGKVGVRVARFAKGLGMKVVVVDPYASREVAKEVGVELREGGLIESGFMGEVDFLTVHTPLLASTKDLIGERELRAMKKGARVLNVARGGVINEEALLRALDEGWIAGAGLDVFTSEPPAPGSTAEKLARHPKVVSTPHLGASTVEAQENVALDVCTQVLEILKGGMPTAAVNAPLILPEEYRKLQPFVKLVERMGSLYTQHFATRSSSRGGSVGGRRFELVYRGELAGVTNTRPLFAALIKGLVSAISTLGGRDVNIVNAPLIARERGIVIDERHVRDGGDDGSRTFASAVTLRSVPADGQAAGGFGEQVIEGYGTLLILHNYDEPGKIGNVGMVLGKHGINISFMQVAALEGQPAPGTPVVDGPVDVVGKAAKEALMILGVAGEVTDEVLKELAKAEGILSVSLVRL